MEYNNSDVRRQDRLLPEKKAYQLLRGGEYGILSMLSPEGVPYAVQSFHRTEIIKLNILSFSGKSKSMAR